MINLFSPRDIDIEKNVSKRSFYCISSNMDYNDSWEVTIAPSITSQTISSNATIALSTKTLSTISEKESKDFCLPFVENKRKENIYKNAEKSKITSLSSVCQKLNHNYSQNSFKSDRQQISVHENKKEMQTNINKDSQPCRDMNNALDAPFIELRAVHKILDFITDSDSQVSTLTNNCCSEISRALQCLLAQRHDKQLEDFLLKDISLHKCERCGVISYVKSYPEKIKRNKIKIKHDDEIITERHCINNDQNNKKFENLINPLDLINNAQLKINGSKVSNQTEYKDKLKETKLLPTNKPSFIIKRHIESPNKTNSISITKADINNTIKNRFCPVNNAKKLFADLEMEKKNNKYECNSVAQNNTGNESKAHTSINKEEVVREISYEFKSQINDLLTKNRCSSIPQTIQASQQMLDNHGDIYPVLDTVKYLARGQFTELDKKEDELFSKLQERRYTRPDDVRNERSSVLYGSREDCPQRDAGFWLFDDSGRLLQLPLEEYLSMPRIDNNKVNISTKISQCSHTTEKMKPGIRSNYMEKDSLEDCALSKQKEESNATIISSSSVDNSIYGSLERKYEINNTDDEDIPRGRKLASSRPSLDIARHVRAQIAKDRHSGKAKESTDELCTHDSNVLVRLSPETRRKICHLIKTIVSSDKDSTFFYKKYLTNMLNNEKLLHSKSADAAFAYSNKRYKIDNQLTDICEYDCIPTKLFKLSEDKNCVIKRQDNFISIPSLELNKSKNSVKIFQDNTTAISSDKFANNSTIKIVRQIVFRESKHREISPLYRKVLDNNRDMDWKNFRKFVEVLHPDEKELWRDVCKAINEEARKDNIEICIEISPVNPAETSKTGEVMTYGREIVFELDMTLKNVENFLDKKLAEDHLDTHKHAEDITD